MIITPLCGGKISIPKSFLEKGSSAVLEPVYQLTQAILGTGPKENISIYPYLLQLGEQNILIDTGNPKKMISDLGVTFKGPDQDLCTQIRRTIGEQQLHRVFLSHAHPDHGNINVLKDLYNNNLCTNGTKIIMSASCKEHLLKEPEWKSFINFIQAYSEKTDIGNGLTIIPYPNAHKGGMAALAVNKSIVFGSDLAYSNAQLISNRDRDAGDLPGALVQDRGKTSAAIRDVFNKFPGATMILAHELPAGMQVGQPFIFSGNQERQR
ncbi:MAG: MBL fold metallo-hydrolase [Holosporales bacterium]|jgi:glyoxylase-like metal-dependent hydrolase (beta-lactamase superfamily II)